MKHVLALLFFSTTLAVGAPADSLKVNPITGEVVFPSPSLVFSNTANLAALNGSLISVYQPLDSDLSNIASLATTSFGRSLLTQSNAAALRTTLSLVVGTNIQAWDADLDTWATKMAPAGTPVGTSDSQTLTNKAIDGAGNTLTNIAPGSISSTLGTDFVVITSAPISEVTGTYAPVGNVNGKPTYSKLGANFHNNRIEWYLDAWRIRTSDTERYTSSSPVAYPWLASWSGPTVTRQTNGVQGALDERRTSKIGAPNVRFIMEGDSLMATMVPQLWTPGKYPGIMRGTIHSIASGGADTVKTASDYATEAASLKPKNPNDEVYYGLLAAANDMAGGGTPPTTTYANLKTAWAAASADGDIVFAYTPLPLKWSIFTNAIRDWHSVLIQLVRSDPSLYRYLVLSDQRFPDASDTSVWSPDGIHLNNDGWPKLAGDTSDVLTKPLEIWPNGLALSGATEFTATGTISLTDNSQRIQLIDSGTASRDVVLPIVGGDYGIGREYLIINTGIAGTLTIKSHTGAVQALLRPGDRLFLIRKRESWYCELRTENAPITLTAYNVDLKAVADTSIFMVPANLKWVTTSAVVEVVSASSFSSPATVSLVESGADGEIITSGTLNAGLDAAGKYQLLTPSVGRVVTGTSSVKFKVTGTAAATSLRADVHVTGYLTPSL